MPEYPDLEVYLDCLKPRVQGDFLKRIRLQSIFLLRTAQPPLSEAAGKRVTGLHRLGKRVVFELDADYFLLLHLMIAGRLRWKPPAAKIPARVGLAAFDFEKGTLLITEAGSKKRASLHFLQGREALQAHDPGGLEIFESSLSDFRSALTHSNHTLKRSLTDPRILSGIGNAYSDEILHRARLSPFKHTQKLSGREVKSLFEACREVLEEWKTKLRAQTAGEFPEKVTAFREGMAVHGRYRQPCPSCGSPVQRVVYASNEANYCASCQTGGKILADRVLSRLLKSDWPRSLEDLEQRGLARS